MEKIQYTKADYKKLKKKAKYLVIVKGIQQKEVGKILGVSMKTISAWSKEGEWRKSIKENLKDEGGIKSFMAKFFDYLFRKEPKLMATIKNHWYDFLKKEEKDIEI